MNRLYKYGTATLLAVVMSVVFYTAQVKTDTEVSDVTLANIEALARIELPPVEVTCSSTCNGIAQCWHWNGFECQFTGYVYDYCVCYH